MKAILAAATLMAWPFAVLSPVAAQVAEPPAINPGGCYIQVPKLAAPPPGGIADLGEAIRALDTAMKPEVEEVNRLRGEVRQLQQRQQTAMQDENSTVDLAKLDEDLRARTAELEPKQADLRTHYSARQKELVGPVQDRIGKVALTYGTKEGCTSLKMARPADLAALTSAGARDITDGFIAFYAVAPR